MSFWNKNKLPAEYKDLTEEQIAEKLNAGAAATAEAATQKAAAEAAAAAKATAETALADANKKNKDLSEALAAAGNGNGGGNNGGGNEGAGRITSPTEADWLTKPNESFDAKITPTAVIALHGAILAARLSADQFISRQGPVELRLWNKYIGDIEKAVNAMPPDQRIMPQTWINQFTFIKGIHLNEVVKEAQGQGDAFFSETPVNTGNGLNTGNGGGNGNADKLTPQEEAIAKRYGRTPEQYLASKKKMQVAPQ